VKRLTLERRANISPCSLTRGRGGKGKELMQRGGFTRVVPNEVPAPVIEGASS